MTTKTDFTPEEWSDLLTAPVRAGMYISLSSFALSDTIRETAAVAKLLVRATEQPPANELMGALSADFKQNQKQAMPQDDMKDPEGAKIQILDKLRTASSVLDQKATPEEASAYKAFVYQAAVDAANAAKEGGFLFFGGEKVNDAERAALAELANIFSIQPF